MRVFLVILLALVALGAAGVWALGEYGHVFSGSQSEAREPLVIEPEIVAANDQPAPPAPAPNSAPTLQSQPAAPAAPAPAPSAAPTPVAPPATTDAAPAPAETAPAEPPPAEAERRANPLRADKLDDTGPALRSIVPQEAPAPAAPPPPPPPPPAAEPSVTAQSAPASEPATAARTQPAPASAAAAPAGGLESQFKSRKVTYNRPPEKLVLNKPTDISLIIDTAGDANAAERIADLPGTVVERDVELSDFVAAELIGADFDIQLQTTAARQKLSPKFANEWRWRVTPTAEGTHTLTLTIYGYATGSLDAEPLAAYRDEIVVEVQQFDQVITWAKSVQPVFAVLAALAGAASALFAFLRFREEKKRGKTSS